MPIEKNIESHKSVFITTTPENNTKAVLYYSSFMREAQALNIRNNIQKSGFEVDIVNINKIKYIRSNHTNIKDNLILSFNGTEYRGEKEINDFYDTHAVLEVYKDIPQVFMDRIKKYLSDRGLRIVIKVGDVLTPFLYYKGNVERISMDLIIEEDHLKKMMEQLRD